MSIAIDLSQLVTAEARAAAARQAHRAAVTAAIDAHVEAAARARQYNSAAHLASYVASTIPGWAAEAQAFVAWRDRVWIAALAILAEAERTGAAPAQDAVLKALPEIAWPRQDG